MSQSLSQIYQGVNIEAHLPSANEIDNYLAEPVDFTIDSMKWWRQHKTAFPTLFRIASRVLITLPTSVPCERVFADSSRFFTKVCNS